MKHQLQINIALVLMLGSVVCAEAQHFNKFGIDLTKALPIVYQKGIVIEPFASYTLQDSAFSITGVFGYSNVRFDTVYQNMTYYNKGYYGKVGFDYDFSKHWGLGLAMIYSNYDEYGRTTFKGGYFGDWQVQLNQNNQRLFGLEYHMDFWANISRHLLFNIQARTAMRLTQTNDPYFGTYYAPGFGLMQVFTGDSDKKTSAQLFTAGLSVRLAYKF